MKMLFCIECQGAGADEDDGTECENCKGSGDAPCDNRGCEDAAVGFNDDGKALCEDCLMEWAANYDEEDEEA